MKSEQSDAYYVQRVQQGHVFDYEVLVKRHSSMVFTVVNQILNNREDTEEVAQDAFLKAFQALKTFKGNSKFSTWLYRIAYNMAISHVRKRKLETFEINENVIQNTTEDSIFDRFSDYDSDETQEILKKLIDELPKEDKALITLFYMEDQSIADIAEITSLSVSNIKVRLFRIRKKMQEDMSRIMQNKTELIKQKSKTLI